MNEIIFSDGCGVGCIIGIIAAIVITATLAIVAVRAVYQKNRQRNSGN